jgi:tetratricopeptide (TPR) repeat protein
MTVLSRAAVAALLVLAPVISGAQASDIAEIAAFHRRAVTAQNAGDYPQAERMHRKVVEAIARMPDFPANEYARQLSNLASALNLLGQSDEALELLQKAQRLLAAHPSRDPAQYSALHFNLGRSHSLRQEWSVAEREFREGVEVLRRSAVSDHAYYFEADAGLGYVYWKTGRLAEAKSRYESAMRFARTLVSPTHPALMRWEREYQAVVEELAR